MPTGIPPQGYLLSHLLPLATYLPTPPGRQIECSGTHQMLTAQSRHFEPLTNIPPQVCKPRVSYHPN